MSSAGRLATMLPRDIGSPRSVGDVRAGEVRDMDGMFSAVKRAFDWEPVEAGE